MEAETGGARYTSNPSSKMQKSNCPFDSMVEESNLADGPTTTDGTGKVQRQKTAFWLERPIADGLARCEWREVLWDRHDSPYAC